MLGLYFQDLYSEFRIRSRIELVQQICLVIGLVFILQAVLTYVDPDLMMPRWLMMMGCGLVLVLVPAWRLIYTTLVFRAFGAERVLFLGANAVARAIVERLHARPELGIVPIGFVDDNATRGETIGGTRVLGPVAELRDLVERTQPERIVVGMTERRGALPTTDLLELRFSGIAIQDAAQLFEATFGRVSTQELRPSQLIFSAELGPQPRSVMLQRWYSLLISAVGIVVFAPVMLVVALAVKLSSPGPILYRQRRVGQHGIPFELYKFRSMVADAEASTGAVWAAKHDPRVTAVGRFMRKMRLDELPQLFNVLKGEMSIVGPRPERPEFVRTLAEQIPFYRQRHFVKPGITGWAQINHKYGDTLEDTITKLEYDLYYIKNLSPALDAVIIFHTAKVMLFSSHGQ
ncbi:MAG TPA: sugar transferase, partial [Bryobacteraceae bacterium]|nr:sugar transferase [Bryobacteraceae bacterium]